MSASSATSCLCSASSLPEHDVVARPPFPPRQALFSSSQGTAVLCYKHVPHSNSPCHDLLGALPQLNRFFASSSRFLASQSFSPFLVFLCLLVSILFPFCQRYCGPELWQLLCWLVTVLRYSECPWRLSSGSLSRPPVTVSRCTAQSSHSTACSSRLWRVISPSLGFCCFRSRQLLGRLWHCF